MQQKERAVLLQQFKIVNYIGLAMMGSIFIFAFLVLAIDKGYFAFLEHGTQVSAGYVDKVRYLLIFVSLLMFLVIKFKQGTILKFLQKQYAKSAYPTVLPLFSCALLVFALGESIAIYGLVLFILSRIATDFFIFMAISLLYFYLFYPKYGDWERVANQELHPQPSR